MKLNHLHSRVLISVFAGCLFLLPQCLGEDEKRVGDSSAVYLNKDVEEQNESKSDSIEKDADGTTTLISTQAASSKISKSVQASAETPPAGPRPFFKIKGLFPELGKVAKGTSSFKSIFDLRKPYTLREVAQRPPSRFFSDDKKDLNAGWVLISFEP